MSKKLIDILKAVDGDIKCQSQDYLKNTEVSTITFSSNKVIKSSIFVAIKGETADGHNYIPDAIKNGASFIVAERAESLDNIPHMIVKNSRQALALLANEFFDDPTSNIKVVGVTGTNGKTTTNWIVYHLLNKLNSPCIRFGTLGREATNSNNQIILDDPDTLTTSDPIYLFESISQAQKAGIQSMVSEVSSHALSQHRTDGINFDVAIFTNLTQDHLDYHKTFEEYYLAKQKLFVDLSQSNKIFKTAVINNNSEYGQRLIKDVFNLGLNVISFGDSDKSHIQIKSIKQSLEGSQIEYQIYSKTYTVKTKFIGHHNAENLAAAIGAGIGLGYSISEIIEVLPFISQVPGRLESCGTDKVGIYVDYAHTPDALENVLKAVRPIVKNKLWVIFGCGGDRDKTKRPKMLKACKLLADKVVVTSDNPRTEDPNKIIEDILEYDKSAELIEVDRREAIKKTLSKLDQGDALIIAGKGHENYQIIGKTKHHFSDLEEVQKNINLIS